MLSWTCLQRVKNIHIDIISTGKVYYGSWRVITNPKYMKGSIHYYCVCSFGVGWCTLFSNNVSPVLLRYHQRIWVCLKLSSTSIFIEYIESWVWNRLDADSDMLVYRGQSRPPPLLAGSQTVRRQMKPYVDWHVLATRQYKTMNYNIMVVMANEYGLLQTG